MYSGFMILTCGLHIARCSLSLSSDLGTRVSVSDPLSSCEMLLFQHINVFNCNGQHSVGNGVVKLRTYVRIWYSGPVCLGTHRVALGRQS